METVSFEAGVRREISTASGQSFSARCAFAQPAVWLMWPFCPLLYRSWVPLPAPTCWAHTVVPVSHWSVLRPSGL